MVARIEFPEKKGSEFRTIGRENVLALGDGIAGWRGRSTLGRAASLTFVVLVTSSHINFIQTPTIL